MTPPHNTAPRARLPGPVIQFPTIAQWIGFSSEGLVHIRSGRVELGQGISTALIQIAAEELDVAPDALRLTQGDTRNTPSEGPTAGSMSISIGGMSLRLAASAARAVMLDHAAGLLQTTPDRLSVTGGAIHYNGAETGLSYGTLAGQVNLARPIADHASPKPAAARRLCGQSMPRVDLAARLRGGALIHDLSPDGMLHGRILQPPALDATLATALHEITSHLSPGTVAHCAGSFLGLTAAREDVVIADAERLAAKLRWTQAPCPSAPDPVAALIAAPAFMETLLDERGAATEADAPVITVSILKPALNHGSIGPSCAVAHWNDAGRLTLWTHSQNVFALRGALSAVLDVRAEDIDVIHSPGAGCYGHNSADDVALDAALLARAAGRPVRVLWSRADEFRHAPLGPAMKTDIRATLAPDGRIASYALTVTSPPHSTRPAGPQEPNLRAAAFLPIPTPVSQGSEPPPQAGGGSDRNALPAYTIATRLVRRARPADVGYRPSAMRGLGAYLNVIAIERMMDACALAAGADPIDYRIAHLDDPRAIAVIRAAQAMTERPETHPEGTGYGFGYARYKNSAGYLACIARVTVDQDVRVTDVWAAADAGEVINPDGIRAQIEGGILQAISWTLKEAVAFADGRITTQSWQDYPILSFSEVPRLEVRLIVHPESPPLGAGEIASGPAGAAVVNAVCAALGVAPTRLPLTRAALITLLAGGG